MKKLIIVMAILLTSCVEKRVESTNWVDIGGKPDVTIHKVGNHQVLTFTFEQDDGELPRLMDVVPSIMLNTITGKKTFALIKKRQWIDTLQTTIQ